MRWSSWFRIVCAGVLVLTGQAARCAAADASTVPAQPQSTAEATPSGATARGNASYYANRFTGRRTASGERYDPGALTAAHRTLPLGTKVKVMNPKNDRSVVVTVNDRGPVAKGRMLDVSSAAADALDMKKSGVTKVETEVVGRTGDEPKTR